MCRARASASYPWIRKTTNALSLDTELSEGDDTEGYTLLVYSVGMLYDSETWETPSDTERIIDLYSFTAGAERDTWEETLAVAPEVQALVEARTAAKKAKNWPEADRIRDELKSMGYEVIDTPQGAKWRRI